MARSGRPKRRKDEDAVPEVYRELLAEVEAEASATASHTSDDGRARKRRRVANSRPEEKPIEEVSANPEVEITTRQKFFPCQSPVIESESSAESDVGWEDVELAAYQDLKEELDADGLEIVLDESEPKKTRGSRPRNAIPNAAQRKLRLNVHQMHLLCMLAHVQLRNGWCNDNELQAALRPILPDRTLSYFNPDPNFSQFQSSRSFIDGLSQASEAWKGKFMKTARGLRRPHWSLRTSDVDNLSLPDDIDPPLEKAGFLRLARELKASRDVEAQLFCALLRAVGVKTRLVCSLQALPFTTQAVKGPILQQSVAMMTSGHLRGVASPVDVSPSTAYPVSSDQATSSFCLDPDSPQPLVPKVARRLGQPSFGTGPRGMDPGRAPVDAAPRRKFIRESQYPVYWVEAFNAALQKWIPVDPLVTKTVGNPLKMEPPASDLENCMSYVVAFEADGVARDVTRRYTKAFNAKTRKSRVECTAAGDEWWTGTMRFFDRGHVLHRDQVESAEFAALEAQEPMPRNVQDFKDHPLYVLERHLRRNQVIHPRNEVGKVAVGKSSASSTTKTTKTSPASKALEPLYRRRDVHVVRPANSWYRLGRDVKAGEQPLKWSLPPRRGNKNRSSGPNQAQRSDASDQEERAEKGLYAEFQTTPYEAPPIVNGRVPRNTYGNLDVFVPSMIPKGGVHLPYHEANIAARLLGIDFADAVTGFDFRGRSGTPVIKGIVTASEYGAAIEAVIQGLREQEAEAEALESSVDCLRMWRRFLVALRIHERVGKYYDDNEDVDHGGGGEDTDVEVDEHDHPDGRRVRGGLMQDLRMIGETTGQDAQDEGDGGGGEGEGGGFLIEDAQTDGAAEPTAGRFLYEGSAKGYRDAATLNDEHAAGGGGFLPPDDDNGDDNDAMSAQSPPAPGFTTILSHPNSCSPHLPAHPSSSLPSRSPSRATANDPCDPVPEKTSTFSPTLALTSAPPSASPLKSPLASPSASGSRSPRRHHANLQAAVQSPGRLREEDDKVLGHDDDDVGNRGEEGREEEKEEGDDDETSLISHDPDDDDAEPDWLLSD